MLDRRPQLRAALAEARRKGKAPIVVAKLDAAMQTIDDIRAKGKPEDMIRLLASREILDRAFGKPKMAPVTSVVLVGSYDMSKLNDDQVRTVADILRLRQDWVPWRNSRKVRVVAQRAR